MQIQWESVDQRTIIYDAGFDAQCGAHWFDPHWWTSRQALNGQAPGRGQSLFLTLPDGTELVWRHYRRGGLIAKLSEDRYCWRGLRQTRPWREFQLTAQLWQAGLPTPRPVAAQVIRQGLTYSADLITVRIPSARPWLERLQEHSVSTTLWTRVGQCIRRFHEAGLNHADLNARNILVNADDQVFLIDFDQCKLQPPAAAWQRRNLQRLQRSLHKNLGHLPSAWQALQAGYEAVPLNP